MTNFLERLQETIRSLDFISDDNGELEEIYIVRLLCDDREREIRKEKENNAKQTTNS